VAVGVVAPHGVGMFTESLCGICAISEISVGFWTTRRCQTTPGRSHFIIGRYVTGSSALPKADADRAGALRALADYAEGLRVSQLRSHRASSGIFCSSFASSRLGGKVFASQYKRSGFADQEGSANLRRTKTLCSFCVLLRFLRVLRLRAVRASRSRAFLGLLASQSVQRIDTQRAPRRHETGSNGHREQHDRHADERRGIGRRHTIEKLPQHAA